MKPYTLLAAVVLATCFLFGQASAPADVVHPGILLTGDAE